MAGSGRVRGVAAALLALPAMLAAQDQRPVVTLEEAIRLAEQVQPAVVSAQTSVYNAEARLRVTSGAFLPSLNFSTSGSTNFSEGPQRVDNATGQIISGDTRSSSLSANISSSIDLFTGFRRGADRRAARAQLEAAEASLTNATFQQRLTTTNLFYDALAAEQLVGLREASLRRAEEQFNVAVNRLQAGAATRSDSLRSLVTVGQARLQLITAQTQLATAEANLGRVIGREGRVRAAADSALFQARVLVDTAGLRAEALANAPTVQSSIANTEAAQASLSASKAAYWPSLSLSGSNQISGASRNDYELFQSRSLSLSLSWPLFNRFNREQNIRTQASALDVAQANLGETRRQVLASLTTRLAELDAAQTRIEITAISVVAAAEDLRVQQERYRLGLATIVDLLTAQESLNQAELDALNARFDYLRAKAQLETLIGRPL